MCQPILGIHFCNLLELRLTRGHKLRVQTRARALRAGGLVNDVWSEGGTASALLVFMHPPSRPRKRKT